MNIIIMNKLTFQFQVILLFLSFSALSQTIVAPNFVLKSHETLEVMRVIRNDESFTLHMLIRNRLHEGGNFCVDKNTFIKDGEREYKVKAIEGIPECPEKYNFSYFGESLQFYLHFPPVEKDLNVIDIEEECSNNCFWIKGLVIDPGLNESIFIAYDYYETGFLTEGLQAYKDLLEEVKGQLPAIEASCIFYIAKILQELGNTEEYDEWRDKLSSMEIEEAKLLLRNLEQE